MEDNWDMFEETVVYLHFYQLVDIPLYHLILFIVPCGGRMSMSIHAISFLSKIADKMHITVSFKLSAKVLHHMIY